MIMDIENGEAKDLEDLASNKFIVKTLGIGSIEATKRAGAGDQKAKEALGKLGQNLGIGIANIINIFDPEAIILAGGIAEAKELIFPVLKRGLKNLLFRPRPKKPRFYFLSSAALAGRWARHCFLISKNN